MNTQNDLSRLLSMSTTGELGEILESTTTQSERNDQTTHFQNVPKPTFYYNFNLVAKGERIWANKDILEKFSGFFKLKLLYLVEDCNTLEMNEDPEILRKCIAFIHGEKIQIDLSNAALLLQSAKNLEIEDLGEEILKSLGRTLCLETFHEVKLLADQYKDPNLIEKCENFGSTEFLNLIGSSSFTTLSLDCILKNLKSNDVKISSWMDLYQSILSWVNADFENRKRYFEEIFQLISLHKISITYRAEKMEKETLITSSEKCRNKLYQSYLASYEKPECFFLPWSLNFPNQAHDPLISRNFDMPIIEKPQGVSGKTIIATTDEFLYTLFMMNNGRVSVQKINYKFPNSTWENIGTLYHPHFFLPSCQYSCSPFCSPAATYRGQLLVFDVCFCESYNPDTNRWNSFPANPIEKREACLLVVGDFIYCIGGTVLDLEIKNAVAAVERYHPDSKSWSHVKPMNKRRSCAGAVNLNGIIYVLGGSLYSGFPNIELSVECYNPEEDVWTVVSIPLSNDFIFINSVCEAHGAVYCLVGLFGKRSIMKSFDMKKWLWSTLSEENWSQILPVKPNNDFDFTIRVDAREIRAHKRVLCENSDYFRAMLTHPMKEHYEGCVHMKEVDFFSLVISIDFMYLPLLPAEVEITSELLYVATLLQAQDLLEYIYQKMKKNLQPLSFANTKYLASMYHCFSVEDYCDNFALENFEDLPFENCIDMFEKNYLQFLLCSDNLVISSEIVKYETILRWVKTDLKSRQKFFEELFGSVNLNKIPEKDVRDVVEKETLITKCKNCKALLRRSLQKRKEMHEALFVVDRKTQHWQSFHFKENRWKKMQKVPEILSKHLNYGTPFVAICLNNRTYIIQRGSIYLLEFTDSSTVLTYRTELDECEDNDVKAIAHRGYIYVFGQEVFERYNPSRNNSKVISHTGDTTEYAVAALLDWIYFLGGNDGEMPLDTVHRFDLKSRDWDHFHSFMRVARCNPSALVFREKIYVLGGTTFEENLSSAEFYDPRTNSWTEVRSMAIPRSMFATCVFNGKIYAISGGDCIPETMEIFDPENQEWTIEILPHMTILEKSVIKLKLRYELLI